MQRRIQRDQLLPSSECVRKALKALREGRMVLLKDDAQRENEYDLCFAATYTTSEKVNFLLHRARGLICVPMLPSRLDELSLPLMVPENTSLYGTAFTISVDAKLGVKSGVSSGDRAATIRKLADRSSTRSDFTSPGHVFPLRCHKLGLEGRQGQTEASIELLRLACLEPVAVICEVLAFGGTVVSDAQARIMSRRLNIPIVAIPQIIDHLQSQSIVRDFRVDQSLG